MHELIEHFCLRRDLSTNDPYDVWAARPGQWARRLFHVTPALGVVPAAALTGLDLLLDPARGRVYRKREYPAARAHAALALIPGVERSDVRETTACLEHLSWLSNNFSKGWEGIGWGVGFPFSVDADLSYPADTPYTTVTAYPLEAFCEYRRVTADTRFDEVIAQVGRFFWKAIPVLEEDAVAMATAYGPLRDRVVTNAVSYTMFAHAMLHRACGGAEGEDNVARVGKLYEFIRREQRPDGSWMYSPRGRSFIDCFHTCIVLKNLVKTDAIVPLGSCAEVVRRGYDYLGKTMFDERAGLFRRFAVSRRPSLVAFDLYDNAEALGLAVMMGDLPLARTLDAAVQRRFVEGMDVFSRVSILGHRMLRNTLRWAVMPYLNALAHLRQAESSSSGAKGSPGGGIDGREHHS